MSDLFAAAGLDSHAPRPLADRLRPRTLAEVVGQDHLLGPGGPIARMVAAGRLASFILWGPPGVGKTTIARLIASAVDLEFVPLSAIFTGVADLRKVFAEAKARRATGRGTLLFVDEIHRFNRAQQDGFLPYMEGGIVTLIGATTENPSFELNPALLSRAQVFTLNRLGVEALGSLLARAEADAGREVPLEPDAREALLLMADGDGRFLLNLVEELLALPEGGSPLTPAALGALLRRRAPVYDKSQEGHYNLASALQKAIRGSDVDAALYWAARMLAGGEDPRFLLRRLIVIASEDVGNADPNALVVAIAARQAFDCLGQPEGEIAIGQLVAYLGAAPKSNRSYAAFKAAKAAARETGSLMPPPHAVNAPTALMKSLGYAEGYVYDHNVDDGFAGLDYFPADMARVKFYDPRDIGAEAAMRQRIDDWDRRRRPARKDDPS